MGTPEKLQPAKQTPGQTARRAVFELGVWCFFGAWSLEFGAFCLVSQVFKNCDAIPSAAVHADLVCDGATP